MLELFLVLEMLICHLTKFIYSQFILKPEIQEKHLEVARFSWNARLGLGVPGARYACPPCLHAQPGSSADSPVPLVILDQHRPVGFVLKLE